MCSSEDWYVHGYTDSIRFIETDTLNTRERKNCRAATTILSNNNNHNNNEIENNCIRYYQYPLPKFLSPLNRSKMNTPICMRPSRAENKQA